MKQVAIIVAAMLLGGCTLFESGEGLVRPDEATSAEDPTPTPPETEGPGETPEEVAQLGTARRVRPAVRTPVAPLAPEPDCVADNECDDGLFCNGAETCATQGTPHCQAGVPPTLDLNLRPCEAAVCDEDSASILIDDADCNDLDVAAIPDLRLWLDAADGQTVELDADGRVAGWSDKSGEGNDAVQPEAARRPAASTGAGLGFDGERWMEIQNRARFDFPGAFTVVAVFAVDAFEMRYQTLLSKGDSAWRVQRDDSSPYICVSGHRGTCTQGVTEVNDGASHVVVGDYGDGAEHLYVDGVLEGMEERDSDLNTNDARVFLGENDERNGRRWMGQVAEVMIFARRLNDDERAAVTAYLATKWEVPLAQ